MEERIRSYGIGAVIALVVLIVSLVFMATGKLDLVTGGMFAALALARLT
jgi:hypothetical protein